MKKTILIILQLLIINFESFSISFDTASSHRFAKPVALAGAYTSIAQGPETVFYNSAGLNFNDKIGIGFSYGIGDQYTIETTPLDFVLLIPRINRLGKFGVSYSYNFSEAIYNDSDYNFIYHNTQFLLSYATKITKSLWFGLNGKYVGMVNEAENKSIKLSKNKIENYDIDIGLLYRITDINLISQADLFQIGLNYTNPFMNKSDFEKGRFLTKKLNLGMSYNFPILQFKKLNNLLVTLAYEININQRYKSFHDEYLGTTIDEFNNLNHLTGMELNYNKIYSFRLGYIFEDKEYTLQLPRFNVGFGINTSVYTKYKIEIDIAYGFWKHQNWFNDIKETTTVSKNANKLIFSTKFYLN